MMVVFDVEPERGATETYYWRETAFDVADYFEAMGDGPVVVWAVTDGRRERVR